ncbi:GNAT family N-acetyltransferase [Bacillus sp. 165]|uniref:GNAT family N-acetyltransferase n=1 Tax=Bacillus sp. 165 TaxID=1529117 RepID=UPI001ADAFA2E|nr:GNAT family N-acetyltransferase [Bacillus sp. 165]MBO9129303.1 GNAT family N-acetyltransferase [Bacillus sp. 165]
MKKTITYHKPPLNLEIQQKLTKWLVELQNTRNINVETIISVPFLANAGETQAYLLTAEQDGKWTAVAVVTDILQNGHIEVGFGCENAEAGSFLIEAVLSQYLSHKPKSISFVLDQKAVLEKELLLHTGAHYQMSEAQMKLENIALLSAVDEIKLHAYQETDYYHVLSILMKSFGDTEEDAAAVIHLSLDDPKRTFYTIRASGVIVGTINLIRAEQAMVTALAIHPEWQHQGIGSQALTKALRMLLEEGYTSVYLDVEIENEKALHVYERVGFQVLHVFDFYRIDPS